MAADRSRLAAALAYKQAEEERRRRMMESVPTTDNLPLVQPTRRNLRTDLESLSSGIGQGVVNQLEGVKALVTDPVGTARATYEGVKGIVRNPTVLADALRYTAQKATSGPLGAGEVVGEMLGPMRGKPPVMQEIDVYHGSPHRFEEFDASKIGTGEGAQAYGHGIYLAESPKVARGYREALSGGDRGRFVEKQGKRLSEVGEAEGFENLTPQDLAARIAAQYSGDINKAVTETKSILQSTPKGYARDVRAKALRELQKNKEQYEGATWVEPGALYTADLPDEMVDRMLDWDKPLSEQPEAVQQAIEMLKPNMSPAWQKQVNPKTTGQSLYIAAGSATNRPSNAAMRLKDVGIPGIRYLDAGSRGQGGSGTRNFVVFPGEEKKVKILKRE